MRKELRELGYDDFAIDLMVKNHKRLLDVGSIQDLYNRGVISKQEAKRRLAQLGYDEKQQEELLILAGHIPSVADFIRFAVRDVFTPDVVEKFRLFDEYPPQLDELGRKAGLDPQYAKYYWAAHWVIPSLEQAFKMYHRGIITREDIELLMKYQDVLPYWRDKLIKLSETPYTRVDVRRMFQLGVLNFEEMVRAYQDLGYPRDKAEKLARFTELDAMEEERTLSKVETLKLYIEGVITAEQARQFLRDLGYTDEQINYLLALEEMRKNSRRIERIKNIVKKKYLKGLMSRNDVVVALSRYGLSSREIDEALELWDLEGQEDTQTPTKAEMFRFFRKGIISEEELRNYLLKEGYDPKHVDWYIEDLKRR